MRKGTLTKEEKNKIEKSYFAKKKQLDNIRDEATIKKWKILSEAKKEGKKIWGAKFTIRRLSRDMDIPYTTVKRCLSLERINKENWKLHKEGKISAFKLAMIAQLKSRTYQDEIVELTIKQNLSTCDIKTLKVNSLKDINKERLRLAVKKGYSRKDAAYKAVSNWITRGRQFTLMSKKSMGEEYYNRIEPELIKLYHAIGKYIKRNGGVV